MGYSVCVSKLAMDKKFQVLKNVHRDSREALAADVVDDALSLSGWRSARTRYLSHPLHRNQGLINFTFFLAARQGCMFFNHEGWQH